MKSENFIPDIYDVSIGYIVGSQDWTPGDFIPHNCGCTLDDEYHDCLYKDDYSMRWVETLENARSKPYYEKLKERILCEGFIEPLTAKISLNNECYVLVDGHTRLCIADELDILTVPVYIADRNMPYDNLVSLDSGWWDIMLQAEGNWRLDRPWTTG